MYTLTLYCRVGISSWSPVFTLTLYYRVGVSTWSPVYTLTLQQAGRPDPPVLDLSEFTVRTPRYTVQWETKTQEDDLQASYKFDVIAHGFTSNLISKMFLSNKFLNIVFLFFSLMDSTVDS